MNQELMTLDFWQDTIIYEDKALPIGTLACDALNVSADTLAKMNEQCQKINLLLGMLNAGQDASALYTKAPGTDRKGFYCGQRTKICGVRYKSCNQFFTV